MKDVIAQRIFDSWLNATPECRASKAENRHLIYEGDGVVLDLLLKQRGDGTGIYIGGQVLPDEQLDENVSDLEVTMERGRQRLHTRTNALGEFSFQTVPDGTLNLSIVLGNRRFRFRGLTSQEPRMWSVAPSFAGGGD